MQGKRLKNRNGSFVEHGSNVSNNEEQPKEQRLSHSSSNLSKWHLYLPSPIFHQKQPLILRSYISNFIYTLMIISLLIKITYIAYDLVNYLFLCYYYI